MLELCFRVELNKTGLAVGCGMEVQTRTPAKFSIFSIIAIVSAVASFATGALMGFMLAIIAVIFGAIGILLAFSSRVRGGLVSTMAVFAGILGLIAAIVKGVAFLF
jgi:hypothetical protein